MDTATIAEAGGIALVALVLVLAAPAIGWLERQLVAYIEHVTPATLIRTREGILAVRAAEEGNR